MMSVVKSKFVAQLKYAQLTACQFDIGKQGEAITHNRWPPLMKKTSLFLTNLVNLKQPGA